jgi:hypothetical protein
MSIRPFFRRLALGAIVGLIATAAYRSIQGFAVDRAEVRHECWMWTRLPFNAAWLWPYVSMFLLVGLPWFLLPDGRQVRRFAACLLGLAAVGWMVFLIHPTACARPAVDGQPAAYALLLAVDQPNNCLPCLHSAFSVLAVWVLATGTVQFRSGVARLLLVVWLLVLCVSIVALRQHTDLDTLAGCVLGAAGGAFFAAGQRNVGRSDPEKRRGRRAGLGTVRSGPGRIAPVDPGVDTPAWVETARGDKP